jgi:Fructose-1,6-bisphosphatase
MIPGGGSVGYTAAVSNSGVPVVEKITLTVVKAGVGGFPGHSGVHEDVVEKAREQLGKASSKGALLDSWVGHVGDDLARLLSHDKGADSKDIHRLAWGTLTAASELADKLKLHSPGKDLFTDTFPGSLRGAGPVVAEVVFRDRSCLNNVLGRKEFGRENPREGVAWTAGFTPALAAIETCRIQVGPTRVPSMVEPTTTRHA